MDTLVGYVVELYRQRTERDLFRVYVADSLRLVPQMSYLAKRWSDVIRPPEEIDAESIVDDVVSRAGLEVR